MKTKKKYFIIPLILIIVFIIILIIVLTKIHKKDKFDYSMSELKADPISTIKNFKFKYTNISNETCFVDIKKINKPNDETSDQLILSELYLSGSGTERFLTVPYNSLTTQLIVKTTRSGLAEYKCEPINIDNPEFNYNIFTPDDMRCITILSIPTTSINEYNIDRSPRFRFINTGDITFEYKIKIIHASSGDILLETKNYNNKCNNGYDFSNWFSVPHNSIVFITYRSCILPGFEKTVQGSLYNGRSYSFEQTNKFSFWGGTWYPNLIFKQL